MKTLKMVLLISFLLTACSSNTNDFDQQNTQDSETTKPQINKDKVDFDALYNGDATSLAGTYVNSEGDIITLNEEGLRKDVNEVYNEKKFVQNPSGFASRSQRFEDQVTGYALSVFDIGFEIETIETDTSKVRISYGHDLPLNEDAVYYKK